jgi:poly(3-hydroxybutyrate) depolymerase
MTKDPPRKRENAKFRFRAFAFSRLNWLSLLPLTDAAVRSAIVAILLCAAYSAVLAKDVDTKDAKRGLDAVFSKSDAKARDKELKKLEGDTLGAVAAAEARTYALQLQRVAPRSLPELDEVHEGSLNYEYEVNGKKTKYTNFALLDLPAGVSAAKPAPLVIGLHSDLGTAWLELSGMRTAMRSDGDHPLRNCIIACPQALNRGNTADDPRANPPGEREYFGWGPRREGIDTVFNLLDRLLIDFNIDRDRVYLFGGAAMGGEACFHLAQLRPSTFAAICVRDTLPARWYPDLPRDADLEPLRKDGTLGQQKVEFPWLECYRNTPVHWVHADGDKKYPTAHAHQARDAMKAASVPLEYYEYEGFHGSGPTATIARAMKAALGHTRTLPTTITARGVRHDSSSMGNSRNYWVEITKESYAGGKGDWPYKILAGGKVTVTAAREDNSLTITTDGVSEIIVYLTDDLLYLDREIKLVVNGEERKATVGRALLALAETASDFRGPGEAYVARLAINA